MHSEEETIKDSPANFLPVAAADMATSVGFLMGSSSKEARAEVGMLLLGTLEVGVQQMPINLKVHLVVEVLVNSQITIAIQAHLVVVVGAASGSRW